MKVYTLFRDGDYLFDKKGGLPIARVATCEIKGELEAVAEKFADIANRIEWDKTAAEAHPVVSKEDGISYNYFRGKAGWIVPARDFVYTTVELPAAIIGLNDINAKVFFNRDCSEKLPRNSSWNVIRAEQNSMLVLQSASVTSRATKATLLVECDPRGWSQIFGSGTMDWLAGDSTVQSLKYLKEAVETETESDEGMSVEEAARMRFMKKQQRENAIGGDTIAAEISPAAKEDLEATVKIFEARLQKLDAEERKEGIDLSELKGRIKKDLAKVKARL